MSPLLTPGARSPTVPVGVAEWTTEINVAWKCKLPSWSNAIPIIVGDKIFITSEPSSLICIDKTKGEILWEKKLDFNEVLTPEQVAEAQANQPEIQRIQKEIQEIYKQADLKRRDLQKEFKLKPGPKIRDILIAMREAQIEGVIKDKTDARKFVEGYLSE
jgi:hypothetical protein